jgi:hypothetical protein
MGGDVGSAGIAAHDSVALGVDAREAHPIPGSTRRRACLRRPDGRARPR